MKNSNSRRWALVPHRHTVNIVQTGVIEIGGQGEACDVELCACLAWRRGGDQAWRGSPFRRRQPTTPPAVTR